MKTTRKLVLFLLLCLPALAATTYYVDPGNASGDQSGSSWANSYVSLNQAENARDADITGIAGGVIFECRCSTATNDTAAVDVIGWTTDSDSPVTIQSTDRTYKLVVSNDDALQVDEDYVILDGIYVETAAINASAEDVCIVGSAGITATNNLIQIKYCTIKGAGDGTSYQRGIYVFDTDTNFNMWNSLIYNVGVVDNASEIALFVLGGTSNIHNCTVVGGKYGVRVAAGTVVCQNVVALGSLTADFADAGGTTTQIHCASEDATGNDFDTNADGNIVSQTLTAFSATYRLTAGNPCIDAGTDLSAATPAVTDDIDGTARGATYDIGTDEYVASGYVRPNFNGGFDEGFDQ